MLIVYLDAFPLDRPPKFSQLQMLGSSMDIDFRFMPEIGLNTDLVAWREQRDELLAAADGFILCGAAILLRGDNSATARIHKRIEEGSFLLAFVDPNSLEFFNSILLPYGLAGTKTKIVECHPSLEDAYFENPYLARFTRDEGTILSSFQELTS